MEWWIVLIIITGFLLGLFLTGLPVAFAFLTLNIVGVYIWMGGGKALHLVAAIVPSNIGVFSMVAVPLFILMGEILFQTGLAGIMVTAVGKWVGRVRGSLSIVAVVAGVVFGMMSGSSMSGVAVLGSTLVPEMRSRGYSKEMSIGPILGAGGLAMIIPPSMLAVLVAILAKVPVGDTLIGGIIPGFILAGLYATYILVRGQLQPHLAPAFAPEGVTRGDKIKSLSVIFPVATIVFLVLGLIFLGVTTPSEAAATGAIGAFLLAFIYRKLSWQTIKKSISETVSITAMVFMIIMGSLTFSQLLAYTGSTAALVRIAVELPVPPLVVVMLMQFVLIVLGCFVDAISMMMITIPIYLPVIHAFGLNPLWFIVMMLVNMEMGGISPPFGLLNFVMKGIVPDATMSDIILAGIPFFLMGVVTLVIMLFYPDVVTWLPRLMN